MSPSATSPHPTTHSLWPDRASVSRVALVSAACPVLPQPPDKRSPAVDAPYQVGLPKRIDLQHVDRFTLEPIATCAERQNRLGRPYVYVHVAARKGPRHSAPEGVGPQPWLTLTLTPNASPPRLDAPSISYEAVRPRPHFAHIDNIFFFCLLGPYAAPLFLGSLDQASTDKTVQLVVTTMLQAERGEPIALLRASLMFAHGLSVPKQSLAAAALSDAARQAGATPCDAATARAGLLFAQDMRWLAVLFGPQTQLLPSPNAHQAASTLAYAVRLEWLSAIVTLIERGLDVDADWPQSIDDDVSEQPLHVACLGQAPRVLWALLKHSRVMHELDEQTPLRQNKLREYARAHGQPSMVTMLDLYFKRAQAVDEERSVPIVETGVCDDATANMAI